jgi:hypothetical protein
MQLTPPMFSPKKRNELNAENDNDFVRINPKS